MCVIEYLAGTTALIKNDDCLTHTSTDSIHGNQVSTRGFAVLVESLSTRGSPVPLAGG